MKQSTSKSRYLYATIISYLIFLLTLSCSRNIQHPSNNLEIKKDFTNEEIFYINHFIISFILENNELMLDTDNFTWSTFNKKNSYIGYQKLIESKVNSQILKLSLDPKFLFTTKNKLDHLNSSLVFQVTLKPILHTNDVNLLLNDHSKCKGLLSLSDIFSRTDTSFIFCNFKKFSQTTNEIEQFDLAFQFRKCKNNDLIKFDYYYEFQHEQFGHKHTKLFDIRNDQMIKNEPDSNSTYSKKAGYLKRKISRFECL